MAAQMGLESIRSSIVEGGAGCDPEKGGQTGMSTSVTTQPLHWNVKFEKKIDEPKASKETTMLRGKQKQKT